ncbi:MAG: NUDIX domain-containing protein [Candidatus Bipolaricaulota bacterium]|nr:MAG: NUDIX domain-containing protein [Candidatus Bipolaricaulota bacterium]
MTTRPPDSGVLPRVQALVLRNGKILMAKHREGDVEYWCLPGGALEEGETPEEGALRELREEARVEGCIARRIHHFTDADGFEGHTFLVEIGDQQPRLGHDPEAELLGRAILTDLQWLALDEIPERDRAFLWMNGLLGLDRFVKDVERWGDAISYPGA